MPAAIPATPCPPNGAGAKTNNKLSPTFAKFTTSIPRNGVSVSPDPRKAAVMENMAPLNGADNTSTRR